MNKTSPVSDKKLKPLEDDDPARLGFDGDYLKPKIESDIWQQFEDDERMRNNDQMQKSPIPPHENESHSRNSLSLFQDALSISPVPEEIDLTDAIKSVLHQNVWYVAPFYFYIFVLLYDYKIIT